MIHVCFGLHDKTGRYSKFTGTAMLSLFENYNTPPHLPSITVHILHDNTLTTDNRDKFSYLAGQYGQLIKFYNVEELCTDKIKEIFDLIPSIKNSRFTIAAFYRFLILSILPKDIDKCIYLDSDILINLDINELWQIELGDKVLAAVTISELGGNLNDSIVKDGLIKPEDYFNSGVMLMNLKILRSEEATLYRGIKFSYESGYNEFVDQTILNYCFAGRTLNLPARFNKFFWVARKEHETFAGRKIYHYTGGGRCQLDMRDPFNRLWMKYFIKTPFFDEIAIGRLYSGVQQMHVGFKQSMINVSALMSGKVRAFFTPPNSSDAIKKIFAVRDDEEIILAENQDSLQKLLDAMNAERGKKVFFILVNNFPFGILAQAGFEYGRDFVNGFEFLSEAHGFPMNSYSLIQAM